MADAAPAARGGFRGGFGGGSRGGAGGGEFKTFLKKFQPINLT